MTTIRNSKKSVHEVSSTVSAPDNSALILINPPPAAAMIPVVPDGFTATDGSEYRGVLPKATQLAVLSSVVQELGRFSDYAQVFGSTAPPIATISQSFDAANQWSLMRVRTIAWEGYCLQQEGLAWIDIRRLMDRLQPLFELAVSSDASIGEQFPGLRKLFNAQRVIAAKAVATKKANRQAMAEGKAPVKGKVGQRRQRAAQKAALIAAEAAASQSASSPGPSVPSQATSPVTVSAANGAPAAPVVAGALHS